MISRSDQVFQKSENHQQGVSPIRCDTTFNDPLKTKLLHTVYNSCFKKEVEASL